MLDNLFYIRDGATSTDIEQKETLRNATEFVGQWGSDQDNFIITTSGSTGVPKPITITRNQMEISARMTIKALNLSAGDNALVCLNTSYIAGKMMIVRGMVGHLNLFITEPSSNPFIDLPKTLQIDFVALVPLQIEAIVNQGYSAVLNKIKAIIVGGAPISSDLAEKIKKLTCPVFATYGMTETVSHIALKRLNGETASEYYQVLDGVDIDQDERGCLVIKSALTNNQTIITNDIVNIVDKQTFEWLGRADNVINSGGVKIHPEQLEDQIRKILAINGLDCNLIITGMPDEVLGEKMVLILEMEELASSVISALTTNFRKHLSNYQSPKDIYCLEQFVYTETSKLKRAETISLIRS